MEPTQELVDAIYCDKVRRAQAMSWEEKFLATGELFEMGLEFMRAGIRHDHPDADQETVERLIDDRLALARRLENRP